MSPTSTMVLRLAVKPSGDSKAATAAVKAPAPSKTDTPSGRKQRLTQKRPRCASAASRSPKLRKKAPFTIHDEPSTSAASSATSVAAPVKPTGLPAEPTGAPLEADISASGATTVKPSLMKNLHAIILGGGAAGHPDNLPVNAGTVARP